MGKHAGGSRGSAIGSLAATILVPSVRLRLAAAFRSYTDGPAKFTRLMAIALADMDGTTPLRAGKRHKALPKGGLFAD